MENEMQTVTGYAMIDSMAERRRADAINRAFERIAAIKHGGKGAAFESAASALGMKAKTLHNLYTQWQAAKTDDERILAVADKRKTARRGGRNNPWVHIFMKYAENDKNTDRGGWEAMRRDFLSGDLVVPGVGNWLQAWQREHPGLPVELLRNPATGRLEPPDGWMPRGTSCENLRNYASADPDRVFALKYTRHGRKAAQRYVLPVLQSRVGVTVGEITQFDDVWLNDDVIVGGRVCRPLAFVGYDFASAYQCARAMKPRVSGGGERMRNLNEYDFRCTLAHHCCATGFWKRRSRFVLEHGTTAIRNDHTTKVRDNIVVAGRSIGCEIELLESGILSEQAHAGMHKGMGGGNFRMKALCEGSHNIVHNALASLPGSRGRDAAHLNESQPALVKYEQGLLEASAKLDPVLAAKIQAGLQTWEEYEAAYDMICREVMSRSDHRLEGWDGRMVREVLVGGRWVDATAFAADNSPEDVALMGLAIRKNPTLVRDRAKSRFEVWDGGVKALKAKGEWATIPAIDMAAFFTMNPRAGRPYGDFVELMVRDNGLVGIRDGLYFGRDELLYRAVIRDRRGYASALPPGRKVLVLVNPLMPEVAVMVDKESGDALGVAHRFDRAPAYDRHAIEIAMGDQAADLAAKVLPVRGRHQAEAEARAARMAENLRVMKEAAQGPQPTGDGYSFEELNGANVSRRDAETQSEEVIGNSDALNFIGELNAV